MLALLNLESALKVANDDSVFRDGVSFLEGKGGPLPVKEYEGGGVEYLILKYLSVNLDPGTCS